MLFNSIHFLIFFPIIIVLYFSLKHKHRWILLLLASYYFYMSWKAEYIILIIFSTLLDYFVALAIAKEDDKKTKTFLLLISILINIGLLFAFKYFNFVSDSLRIILSNFSIQFSPPVLKILLPVGISFYTFQTLGYTIDVYRNKIKPEKHLGIFSLYVSFFPQLVAGPIERAQNLLPQFLKKHYFDYARVTDGLKLMLWGFFKKIVIADNLAIYVDLVYNNPEMYTGLSLIIATIFFAFQIYCDFSGYSDIAIGASQVMGFKLMDNFKRPYYSKSISEFWKRWHISLSSWFKDYLYISLGGNRVSISRLHFNLFITFLISGLWHGANWTFVVWGALHAFYMIFSLLSKNIREKIVLFIKLKHFPRLNKYLQILTTFSLVTFAWIFFRAKNISDAFYIVRNLFNWHGFVDFGYLRSAFFLASPYVFVVSLFGILSLEFVHLYQRHDSIRHMLLNRPVYFRFFIYFLLLFSILLCGNFSSHEFIYFQF
ncbi:MAG: MBOAT family O-acyltransferase [Patescibacteria group bacterium]